MFFISAQRGKLIVSLHSNYTHHNSLTSCKCIYHNIGLVILVFLVVLVLRICKRFTSPPPKKSLPTSSYESNAEFNANLLLLLIVIFPLFSFFSEVIKNIKTASIKIQLPKNLKVCHLKIGFHINHSHLH